MIYERCLQLRGKTTVYGVNALSLSISLALFIKRSIYRPPKQKQNVVGERISLSLSLSLSLGDDVVMIDRLISCCCVG